MSHKLYLSLGIASLAALVGASSSQAAALDGRVGVNPFNEGGQPAGLNIIGTGLTAPNGDPLTSFDFVPPEDPGLPSGGTTGAVIELNANQREGGRNDFAPFVADTGTIQDLSIEEIGAINAGTPLDDFILTPGAFSFQLAQVNFPVYTDTTEGTTVSVGVEGTFFNLSDGSNDASPGIGTFSVDFAGLDPDEVRALFDEPGELSEDFSPTTYSSNFVATEEDVPPPPPGERVPEASNLLGLLVVGFGGATMLMRKSKLQ